MKIGMNEQKTVICCRSILKFKSIGATADAEEFTGNHAQNFSRLGSNDKFHTAPPHSTCVSLLRVISPKGLDQVADPSRFA